MNAFRTSASNFNIKQVANKVSAINGLSIIDIIRRILCANVTLLKALPENVEFSFNIAALAETWFDVNNAHVCLSDGFDLYQWCRKNWKDVGVLCQCYTFCTFLKITYSILNH